MDVVTRGYRKSKKLVHRKYRHGCYISNQSDDPNWQLINHIYSSRTKITFLSDVVSVTRICSLVRTLFLDPTQVYKIKLLVNTVTCSLTEVTHNSQLTIKNSKSLQSSIGQTEVFSSSTLRRRFRETTTLFYLHNTIFSATCLFIKYKN